VAKALAHVAWPAAGGQRRWPTALASELPTVDDGFHRVANAVANVACRRPTALANGSGPGTVEFGGRRS